MNVFSANAIDFGHTTGGSRNQSINLAAAHMLTSISAASPYSYFSGLVKVGAGCASSSSTSGISNSCTPQNASDFTLTTGINLAPSIVGKVTTDDAMNSSDANGLALNDSTLDFFRFANRYRFWGKEDAAAVFHPNHRGFCSLATNCRIWDASLTASDTVVRAVLLLPSGNDTFYHRWKANTLAVCNTIRGAQWQPPVCSYPGYYDSSSCTTAGGTWQTGICATLALRNAIEISNDGYGNDNGLCESNEHCLYTPNIGAYQGHGALVRAGSSFNDGAITGVVLWRYQSNGY